MKVYFLPSKSELNVSLNMIVAGLENAGIEVVNKDYTGGALIKAFSSFVAYKRGARVFHFNFLENYAANKSFKSMVLSRIIILWLTLLKLLNNRLVWTMNNKTPHNCTDGGEFYRKFMGKYLKLMDATIVYCEESKDILINEYGYPKEKICKVVHGCFIPKTRNSKEPNEDGKLHLICFGLVSKYKNVPLLIKAFKKADLNNTILRIYGKCETENLKYEIERESLGVKGIEFYEGFLPENKVDDVFKWADAAVYPYDKNSMLNSGAVIMGISQGKVILVTEFGYVKEINNQKFVYSYDYTNEEDHIAVLADMLNKMEKEYRENPIQYEQLGISAYKFASINLDWNEICRKIVKYY